MWLWKKHTVKNSLTNKKLVHVQEELTENMFGSDSLAISVGFLKMKCGFCMRRCKTVQKEEHETRVGRRVNPHKAIIVSHLS